MVGAQLTQNKISRMASRRESETGLNYYRDALGSSVAAVGTPAYLLLRGEITCGLLVAIAYADIASTKRALAKNRRRQ